MSTGAALLAMSAAMIVSQAVFPSALADQPLLQILVLTPVGALTYAGTALMLWRVAGRPAGPIREMLNLGARASDFAVFWKPRRT